MRLSMDHSGRMIVHIDLDTFFVSVERLKDDRLKGKPVAVGGTGDRGVVASCSYEARAFGVHSAMPMRQARILCPELVTVRGDYEHYSHYSNTITEIVKENVPLYEKSSIDEFYIDMTGMDRFFGTYTYMQELRERIIRETGLPISFGLSENKTVSKVATGQAKPNNHMKIDHGVEKSFLAPLPVKKIPMVGEVTGQLLRKMGIVQIKTIQEMPQQVMENILGENGRVIWRKANGIDTSPVEPYTERKSISSEETFESDTIDVSRIRTILMAMTENLAYQLRKEGKLTSVVAVKIRYSDFDTHTKQIRIPYTSTDHTLMRVVKELFDKLYERRVLIRLVGVRLSGLVNGGYQINLLEDAEHTIRLYQEMDHVRKRFGDTVVQRASAMGYKMRRFNPFKGER
ncbi:MAG TPA: DNA polymerase IV [Chitinophagales bacterium]|nr:DNA polymerase IV [Chitinophagales bacterium]HMZ89863.1 DNA polymerase IV [Chitinophagales bacterium]HNE45191.1 DNA polymerase IV [Chitinophagales bacterium]HNF68850.1 DNA polymerase IV [Chitinophagales bacterium]HNJ89224.1 DNA polymerase IV [Chitinophagales bacterium]